MTSREEYYARIEKITGGHLFKKTIGVHSAPFVSKAIELAIMCGVLGVNFRSSSRAEGMIADVWGFEEGADFENEFVRKMKSHNQFEDRWRFSSGDYGGTEELILAGGSWDDCEKACLEAHRKNIPAVIGLPLQNGTSVVSVVWPGEEIPFADCREQVVPVDAGRYFDWIDLNNQMANIAKAILLEGSPWERSDVMSLLKAGKNTILLAHPEWPWISRWIDMSQSAERQWLYSVISGKANRQESLTDLSGKTVLIVGLGSLGGIAAEHFRTLGCNIVGIDGKEVSIHNPIRQVYSTADVGQSKAHALARILARASDNAGMISKDGMVSLFGAFVGLQMEIPDSRIGSTVFEQVLETYAPDLVVLATAHPAEYRMADECRKRNIPHVIGRCYNRARWFEITAIDGNNGPCFGCLQGHLYKGAPASLTEEQLARYDMAGDEVNAIQAEPATRVDTARCADIMARFGMHLLTEHASRAGWFSRMLTEERTCLIGGNYAEFHEEKGEWSFGVTVPGGVALYGVINFIGSETENVKTCLYCGKTHEVLIKRKKFNG